MRKKLCWTLLVALYVLVVSGCSTPPDGPVCVELTPIRGHCFHTIKNEEQDVDDTHLLDGKTWKQVHESALYVPAGYWAKLKSYLLTQCKKTNKCGNDLGKWETQAQKIDQGLEGGDN